MPTGYVLIMSTSSKSLVLAGVTTLMTFAAAPTARAYAQTAAPSAVILLDYQATPPSGWQLRKPSSTARLLELVQRDGAPKDSVELVIYYFGRAQGGGVAANVERWTAQFNGPGRPEAKPRIEKIAGTKYLTTEVELEGSYTRAIGMGDPGTAVPGQALYASIVETPRGSLFVQMFGPAELVRAQRAAYLEFVKGIRDR